jgi:hypothetical protein
VSRAAKEAAATDGVDVVDDRFFGEAAPDRRELLISIANALDASVEIKPRSRRSTHKRRKRVAAAT